MNGWARTYSVLQSRHSRRQPSGGGVTTSKVPCHWDTLPRKRSWCHVSLVLDSINDEGYRTIPMSVQAVIYSENPLLSSDTSWSGKGDIRNIAVDQYTKPVVQAAKHGLVGDQGVLDSQVRELDVPDNATGVTVESNGFEGCAAQLNILKR